MDCGGYLLLLGFLSDPVYVQPVKVACTLLPFRAGTEHWLPWR